MKTIKIALTGGPRGGKTRILNEIQEHIEKREDCKLFCIPETASELSKNLVKPKDVRVIDFQKSVFARQLFKENEAKQIINYCNYDKNVIVCDRGIMDNKAYLENEEEFTYLMNKYECDELELLDSYDLVLYLVSSSISDELKYETESNPERFESKSEAFKLDEKTKNAWLGHRNIKTIMPSKDFQFKIDETLRYVDEAVDLIRVSEFENHEIVPEKSNLNCYDEYNSKKIQVEEIYLNKRKYDEYYMVILKRTYKGFSSYFFQYKTTDKNKEIILNEERINYDMYLVLIRNYDINKIIKREETSFFQDYDLCKILDYGNSKTLQLKPYCKVPNNITIK